jgi:sortase (surface protein transpeptidase)
MRPGDRITVLTRDCVTVYRVSRMPFRVLYTDIAVLRQTRVREITLVTCWPINVLYFVPHRTIVQGVMVSSVPRRLQETFWRVD